MQIKSLPLRGLLLMAGVILAFTVGCSRLPQTNSGNENLITGVEKRKEVADMDSNSFKLSEIKIPNLPESFYQREGLKDMPRIDYSSMCVVNVKDFGASADGKLDNKEAFTAAVKYLIDQGVGVDKGGIVYIPKGVYAFLPPDKYQASSWCLNPDVASGKAYSSPDFKVIENIHFVGDGEGSVIRIVMRGILQGEKFEQPLEKYKGWFLGGSKNISLSNLTLSAFPYVDARYFYNPSNVITIGEKTYPTENVQVIGVTIDQSTIGIKNGNDVKSCWVVDSRVMNTTADGIAFYGAQEGYVMYNYVENAGDDNIALWADANNSRGNTYRVFNNTCIGGKFGRGMLMKGYDVLVKGNWIEQMVGVGLFSSANDTGAASNYNIKAEDNTIIRAALVSRGDNQSIGFKRSSNVLIEGNYKDIEYNNNRIYGSALHGFSIENAELANINFEQNKVYGSVSNGVNIDKSASVKGITISDNHIANSGGQDVSINGSLSDVSISGNKVSKAVKGHNGFEVINGEVEYTDIYSKVKNDKSETSWQAAPDISPETNLQVINVRDFGAKGDGITNDYPAFYNAINALPASGAKLSIPSGKYLIEVPLEDESKYRLPFTAIKHHLLVKDKSNVHIVGEGSSSVVLFTNPDFQGLRMINVTESSISRVKFALDKQPAARHNRALLDISASYDVAVQDIYTLNSSGPGILVDASTRVSIKHSVVEASGTYGIKLAGSRQIFVQDNQILNSRDNSVQATHFGSISREPQYIKIEGNKIDFTREGAGIGIAHGDNIEVSRNDVQNTYLAGIYIYLPNVAYPLKNVVVQDNTLTNCNIGTNSYTGGAISCLMGAHKNENNANLASVLIKGNVINDTPLFGIYTGRFKAVNMTIESNKINGALKGNVLRDKKTDGSYQSIIDKYIDNN